MICSEYSTFCQPCWHFRRIRSARVATPAPVPVSPGRHPDDETPRAYIWRTGNVRCGQESKSPVAFLRACGRIPGVLRGLLDLRKFIGINTEVNGLPPEVHRTSGPTGQKSMDFWIPETLFLAPAHISEPDGDATLMLPPPRLGPGLTMLPQLSEPGCLAACLALQSVQSGSHRRYNPQLL